MLINKGDILTEYTFWYCDKSNTKVLIDQCGNIVVCELECTKWVDPAERVFLASENILLDGEKGMTVPINTRYALIQYKVKKGNTGNNNEVAYSTTDGRTPSYEVGQVHTHLGIEELTLCQFQSWKAAPVVGEMALVNIRYFA